MHIDPLASVPTFAEAVGEVLASLKAGDVLSYGEVAQEAGYPRSARAVGRFLQQNDGYPWWRIVTAQGRLAPGHETRQTKLLRDEGVHVTNGYVTAMKRTAR